MEKKFERQLKRSMKALTAIAIILAMVVTTAISGQSAPLTSFADDAEITVSVPFGTPLEELLAELEELLEELEEPEEWLEEPEAGEEAGEAFSEAFGEDGDNNDDANGDSEEGQADSDNADGEGSSGNADSDNADGGNADGGNADGSGNSGTGADDHSDNDSMNNNSGSSDNNGSENSANGSADSSNNNHESNGGESSHNGSDNNSNNGGSGGTDNGANDSTPASDKTDSKGGQKESSTANMPFPLSGKVLKTLQSFFAMPVYGAEPEKEFLRWEFDPPYPADGVSHDVYEYTVTPIYKTDDGSEVEGTAIIVKVEPPKERVDAVGNLAELQSALAYINDNASKFDKAVILLTTVITIPDATPVTIESNVPVTLTVKDNHRHFQVDANGELTLGKGVTLTRADGYTNYGGGVEVSSSNTNYGGGDGGIFNLDGGVISGNAAPVGALGRDGGGVYVGGGQSNSLKNGTFNMYSGRISDNTSNKDGGGVRLGNGTNHSGGVFNLYGGSISNNEAKGFGGGVYMGSSSVFNLYDGAISENFATDGYGGGVYMNSASVFTLYDGHISDNEAFAGGGVSVSSTSAKFEMAGGKLSGNEATLWGGGVFVGQRTTFTMTGGEISGNTTIEAEMPGDRYNPILYGGGGGIYTDDLKGSNGEAYGVHLEPKSPQSIVFQNNRAARGDAYRITDAGLLSRYKEMIKVPDGFQWSHGLPHGFNNHDIGAYEFATPNPGSPIEKLLCVTFDPNIGGSGQGKDYRFVAESDGTVGEANLPIPTRTGYDFSGWYTEPDGSGTAFTGDTEITTDTLVYAWWTEKVLPDVPEKPGAKTESGNNKSSGSDDKTGGNSGGGKSGNAGTEADSDDGAKTGIGRLIDKITGGNKGNSAAAATGTSGADASSINGAAANSNSNVAGDSSNGTLGAETGGNSGGTLTAVGTGSETGISADNGLTVINAATVPLTDAQANLEDGSGGRINGTLAAAGTFVALGIASLTGLFLLLLTRRKEEREEAIAEAVQL